MKKILAALFIGSISVLTYQYATYDPVPDIINALREGKTVTLDSGVVYNFTGYKNIKVTGEFNLNGATIKADSMLQIGFNDNHLLFNLLPGASIVNGTIRGASGRSESLLIGYFGAVKTLGSARIENMKFINCDKWAICSTGDRFSFTDTVWITNCTFDSIARTGGGYAVFNPYSTVIMTGCVITNVRHAFDMGGSPNPIGEVRGNTFRRCYFIPINQHKIDGQGTCGAGLTIVGNYFYDNYIPMQLVPPNSGTLRIDSNYFAGNIIGTVADSVIPKGTNYLNGENMPIGAKIIATKKVFQVSEPITLKTTSKEAIWNTGTKSDKITLRATQPQVKVFSCYTRGIADTVTILVQGAGKYTGFRLMASGSSGKMELYRGEKRLQSVASSKFLDYRYFMQGNDSVAVRLYAPCIYYMDDYVTDSYYQTFETGVDGLRISYKNGAGSVSRKLFNVSSGYRNLTVEVTSGWIEVGR